LRFSNAQDLKWIKTPDPNGLKNSSENELDHEEGSFLSEWPLNGTKESEGSDPSQQKRKETRLKECYVPLAFSISNFMILFISTSLSVAYHWQEILEKRFCQDCIVEAMPKKHPYILKLGSLASLIFAGFTFYRYYQYAKQRFSVPENKKHYYLLQVNMALGLLTLIFLGLFGIGGNETTAFDKGKILKNGK